MAKRTWNFSTAGRKHTVELNHNIFTGKRTVWLDSKEIISDRRTMDTGSQYRFAVDGETCEVAVVTNGVIFDYYLLLEGKVIEPVDGRKRERRLLRKALTDKIFWYQLGRETGLEYHIQEAHHGPPLHRLVGSLEGYLLVLHSVTPYQQGAYHLDLSIRCAPTEEPLELEKQIKKDAELKRLAGRPLNLRVEVGHVWLRIMYQPGIETPEILSERISNILRGLAEYVGATKQQDCEGERCQARPYANPGKVVLVNEIPYLLCEGCMKDIPKIAERDQVSTKNTLPQVIKAVGAGLVGVVLGALIWAVIGVYLNIVAAVTGALILWGILKLMDLTGARTNIFMVLLAGVMSFASVILGEYFLIIGYVMKEYSAALDFELLDFGLYVMFDDPVLLVEPLFYAALGILWVGWATLRGRIGKMRLGSRQSVEQIK